MISKLKDSFRPAARCAWAALLSVFLIGCGAGAPRPADTQEARGALQVALDAWQRGEAAGTLRGRRPAIQVVDHDGQAGRRLVRYQIAGPCQPAGNDLRCEALLWLRDRSAKPVLQRAAYSIGTSPALTIVREDP